MYNIEVLIIKKLNCQLLEDFFYLVYIFIKSTDLIKNLSVYHRKYKYLFYFNN